MTDKQNPISRRNLLAIGSLGILSLAGCVDIQTDPRGQDDSTGTPTSGIDFDEFDGTPEATDTPTGEVEIGTLEEECTSAYISNFEWEANLASEDTFYGVVINQGDVAGEIVVKLIFYENEEESIRTGTTRRTVSIGAQETQDIVINANPPTDDSSWAVMEVSQQACVLDLGE